MLNELSHRRRCVEGHQHSQQLAVESEDKSFVGMAHIGGVPRDGVEYRLDVRRQLTDYA
jgi:hypothetical protein